MFVFNNPNPKGSYVGDCVVRAIVIATDKSWFEVFVDLCVNGLLLLTSNFFEKLNKL